MATPTPLSAQKGLRATQTPQAYDRNAAEERRQLVRKYREQERRNQELREGEARERQETAEREYAAYKDSADKLRAAESERASAAAAFNAVRDRFNAAQTAEEQKRLEPELLRRADEYNAAAKNLEERAFLYNASMNAAQQARVISADAQPVSYKADRLDVRFEKVEEEEQEETETDGLRPTLSLPQSSGPVVGANLAGEQQQTPRPTLSLPESPGMVVGENFEGGAFYIPESESKKVVAGTQTVTAPGVVSNTASLIITDPASVQNTPAGVTLADYSGPLTGENLATNALDIQTPESQNPLYALRVEVGNRLVEGGAALSEKTGGLIGPIQSAIGEAILDPSKIQKEETSPSPEEYREYNKELSGALVQTGGVVSELTGTNLGNVFVWMGEDVRKNVPYVTEGIKITEKGIENLPSPGLSALMGVTAGAAIGVAGAAGAFAGGFGNPVNLIRSAAPLAIEGEAVTGGFAGGSAGGAAVVSAGETVGKSALAGISLLADGYGNAGFYSDREMDGSAGIGILEGSELTTGSFSGRLSPSELQGENKIFPGDELTADIPSESYPTKDKTNEIFSDRNADQTIRDQKQEEARKTTGATAAASALSFSTAGRISNSELDVNDYINVVITPEITREEYAKRTPFIDVTKNPYEYGGQNKVANSNRFESYFAFDFPTDTALRTKRKKLPDIDLPESKKRKKKQSKSAGRGDDYYYTSNWLPKASDLFGSAKQKRGKKKSTTDSLFRQTKRKGGRLI